MKKKILFLSTLLLFCSCDVVNNLGGTYQLLTHGEYRFHSLSNIELAGIGLGNASAIPASKLVSLATVLAGGGFSSQSIPLSMTLNLNVTNPNKMTGFIGALDYVIQINEMDLVEGKMESPVSIGPGETAILPIPVSVDLKGLIARYSRQRVSSEMSDFLGITHNKTSVTVKLWPKFSVGSTLLKSPVAIPVTFDFGGKN
ncbi:MAG: LEA type 2 family protein [Proteiniphilum sp.]|jgi:LEA14-like dessication related protein|nr:LEA type 2 family protein [Proteiniphilum sp.]